MDESVKTSLTKMLEYQKEDIELKKLINIIDRDEALASMQKYKKAFNDAKTAITDGEAQASSLVETYEELVKYIADNEAVFAQLEAEETETEDELSERVKKLESIKSKFQSADKKAHDLDNKAREICKDRVDALKSGNAAKQRYNESKEKHQTVVRAYAAKITELKTALSKRVPELDPKLFAEYQSLVNDNKFPPLVPAHGDDKKGMYNCGGCGIGLSQQANNLVKDKGWCRCDNCRRIIYKL